MTLDEALARLAAGDQTAFGEVYERTRKSVYYIALSVVRERMLAEDVMQTVYLKVLGNAARYRRGTNAAAWIARIARNEALDVWRRRSREISVDERADPLPFGTCGADEYGLLIDLARRILKREEFSVLMLAAAEGYKRREIAAMLSMPLPTVTWHYSRAVSKMKAALSEERTGGGGRVERGDLERELRREAEQHTPDVYNRVMQAHAAQPAQSGAVAAVLPRRRIALIAALAAVLVLLACILPFALRGTGAFAGSGGLYISINPCVEFVVEEGKVTSVKAINRDAAVLLAGEDLTGLSPEEAGVRFARLSEQKHLITAQGVEVYATGADAEELERRVKARLQEEFGGAYTVGSLSQADLDALVAAYDEQAMGDFEDYLERELAHLREGFADRVRALLATYEADLSAVSAGGMSKADFNKKYLYLGEDVLFEDGDEEAEDLLEEFEELRRETERGGDAYIFEELYDEFLEAVEELYEETLEGECGDDEDDD